MDFLRKLSRGIFRVYVWEKGVRMDKRTGNRKNQRTRTKRTGKKRRNTYHAHRCDRKELLIRVGIGILLLLGVILLLNKCIGGKRAGNLDVDASQPPIDVQLLDINEYSRPGIASDPITGIVIHYTANPGSTAQENRDYFNNLKDTHETSVSSHFVVGLDGEIVQCVPTWEIAYASNERNHDTVSIECCHPDETGEFTDATYASAVQLTAFLCKKYNLTEESVIRHYDVTGKNCPKYFVENEDAWSAFQADVKAALEKSAAGESSGEGQEQQDNPAETQ